MSHFGKSRETSSHQNLVFFLISLLIKSLSHSQKIPRSPRISLCFILSKRILSFGERSSRTQPSLGLFLHPLSTSTLSLFHLSSLTSKPLSMSLSLPSFLPNQQASLCVSPFPPSVRSREISHLSLPSSPPLYPAERSFSSFSLSLHHYSISSPSPPSSLSIREISSLHSLSLLIHHLSISLTSRPSCLLQISPFSLSPSTAVSLSWVLSPSSSQPPSRDHSPILSIQQPSLI